MAYNEWMFPFYCIQTTSAISILPYYSGSGLYMGKKIYGGLYMS